MGGYGLRLLLPAGQPGGHLGHQPPGSERPGAPPAPRREVPETLRGLWVSQRVQERAQEVFQRVGSTGERKSKSVKKVN